MNHEKPAFKTTEYWAHAIAQIAGLVMASGAIVEGSQMAQIIGLVITVAAAMSNGFLRTKQKDIAAKLKTNLAAIEATPKNPTLP